MEKKSSYSNGVIKRINEDNYNIEHLCSTKPGASGCPIINLNNNRVIGIHKGADIKNWNVGTFIKDPIIKFYEEIKKKENKINKEEKEKELNNSKKESNNTNEKENNKIDNDDKKEINNDHEIENKIDYCILPEDYPNYDLSFKVIVIGNKGKIFYIYIFKYIGTGKGCLALRAIKHKFENNYLATVGFEFLSFNIKIKNKVIKLQIWDTCVQEIYPSLISNFYRNSSLAFLVYSIDE